MKPKTIHFLLCILAFCVCLPALVPFCATLFIDHHESITDLSQYRADGYLPALEDLPDYKAIQFQDHTWNYGFHSCDSTTLWVQYDPDTYAAEKDALEDAFAFQTAPFTDFEEMLIQPSFPFGTYTFRLLSLDAEGISYPNTLFLVGTSDTRCAIAYIRCNHPNLTSIDDFGQYLAEDCGWGQTFNSEVS